MSALLPRLAVLIVLAVSGTVAASPATPARHRRAVSSNTAGLRLMKAGQTALAVEHFRDALAFAPDYALAHYNLACASSLLRDVPTAVTELEWLAARAHDPVAKARMEKALGDTDLDFVSVVPRARQLLDMPPFATEHIFNWLAERDGNWSAELPPGECEERSYTFRFAADGVLELTTRESCAGEPAQVKVWEGTVTSRSDGTLDVDVTGWAQWPSAMRLAMTTCPGLPAAPGSCFMLVNGSQAPLGPFHRGAPGSSSLGALGSQDLALSTGK
jgi:hypothetical protein